MNETSNLNTDMKKLGEERKGKGEVKRKRGGMGEGGQWREWEDERFYLVGKKPKKANVAKFKNLGVSVLILRRSGPNFVWLCTHVSPWLLYTSPLWGDKSPQYCGIWKTFKSWAHVLTVFTAQGQILHARVDPWCTLRHQISPQLVYNHVNLTDCGIFGGSSHRPRKHGVKGVNWPPTFSSAGSSNAFWPPTFSSINRWLVHFIF